MKFSLKKTTKHDVDKLLRQDAPSDVAFWTVVQRYYSFEEPSSRWSKLRKSLQKQLKKKKGSASSELDSMTLEERSQIFSQIFGNWNGFDQTIRNDFTTLLDRANLNQTTINSLNRIVSILLAFEDITRFNKLAFDLWMLESDTEIYKPDYQLSNLLADQENLSESERLWLMAHEAGYINWCRLLSYGPWSEDHTSSFIVSFIKESLEKLSQKSFKSSSLSEQLKSHIETWKLHLKNHRKKLPGDFLPNTIVLVEGSSEKILVPVFCNLVNLDVNLKAVEVKACGGAKQVVKQYLNLRDIIELPIVSVLDADVFEESQILEESLRDIDSLHVLSSGELEDTYSRQSFLKIINLYLAKVGTTNFLTVEELNTSSGRVEQMTKFWRKKKLGEFDKVEFAKIASQSLGAKDVPVDFIGVIGSIKESIDAKRKSRFAK